MTGKPKTPAGVQSVRRALDVLEIVGRTGPMGVTEIAHALDLHVATVHNLLRTLAARHYLINEAGRYRLGPAAAVLAGRFDPLQALPILVDPHLHRIVQRTGESASATILVGSEAHLVGFLPGTQPVTIHFPQYRWPDAQSLATGRLLVALTKNDDTPTTGRKTSARLRDLQRIRDDGYCLLRRPDQGGQLALAVPVWAVGDKPLAAVGSACPGFRATLKHARNMLDAVWDATTELSAELGCETLPRSKPRIRSIQPRKTALETAS